MSANSETRRRRWFGKAAVLIGEPSWVLFSFFFVAILVYSSMTALPALEAAGESTLGQLVLGAIVYVLVVCLAVLPLFMTRTKQYVFKTLGVDRRPGVTILWWPLLAWGAYMAATIFVMYAVTFIPWIDGQEAQDVGFKDLTQPFEYVLAFIALVVLPPIAEELLFRGYLFGRLRQRFGFWLTTLVVSVVFGLVHMQWNVGIDVAILSIFLCTLREVTGSLWASMALHAIKNGVAYVALFILPLLGS